MGTLGHDSRSYPDGILVFSLPTLNLWDLLIYREHVQNSAYLRDGELLLYCRCLVEQEPAGWTLCRAFCQIYTSTLKSLTVHLTQDFFYLRVY